MKNRVTLRDVAQLAGVSVTTVSNVVRGWPYIAADTRHKVQEAIEALGYSPHPIAQGLRTGQMQTIGIVVPDISNPYFSAMVSVAEDVAQEHRYSVIIFSSHEDMQRQTECIRRATSRMVDGLLIVPVAAAPLRAADSFADLSLPTVILDRLPEDYDGPACTLDNFRVGQRVAEYLCAQGHERIAHIAGPMQARPARERAEGYSAALRQARLEYREIVYAGTLWSCADGYQQMRSLLALPQPPTAVFASNDLVAIGALRALDEAGLRCPDDVSIVGVDDIEVSAYTTPTLTTVRQPLREMAHTGIQLLLTLIRGGTPTALRPVLAPELIERGSAAPPSTGGKRS